MTIQTKTLFEAMLPVFHPGTVPDDPSPRARLERAIEAAIALLNELDGDPDLDQDAAEHDDDSDGDNALDWHMTPAGIVIDDCDLEDDDPLEASYATEGWISPGDRWLLGADGEQPVTPFSAMVRR
jgi:hypothetical protein